MLSAVTLEPSEIEAAARLGVREDIGAGDATSLACIAAEQRAAGVVRAREPLVVAGVDIAIAAFRSLDPNIKVNVELNDGRRAEAGAAILHVAGAARAILGAERTALNFLQWLSGVATFTACFAARLEGLPTRLLDTRKTTPGWRRLEKYAVACGGGTNHRMRLDDRILIKDNHLAALRGVRPNPVSAAVRAARTLYPHLPVEVEADTPEQAQQAVDAGADVVLLDNMTLDELRTCVALARGRTQTEASGGVRLESVRAIAETGVDFVSVGAIIHGARWVDLGLDFET